MVTLEDFNREVVPETLPPDEPDVVALDQAGSILETLSSETRRAIVATVSEEPANAATIAERVGTSVQNALYHLEKLREAGLVTVVCQHYSKKGLEMDVYGPASSTIVIDVMGSLTVESAPPNDGARIAPEPGG